MRVRSIVLMLSVGVLAGACGSGAPAAGPPDPTPSPSTVDVTSSVDQTSPTDASTTSVSGEQVLDEQVSETTTTVGSVGSTTETAGDEPVTTVAGEESTTTVDVAESGEAVEVSEACEEGAADPLTAEAEFLWVGRGVRASDGSLVCLPPGAGGWTERCTDHGCFRIQTLADHWPDGTWDAPSIYRGYQRDVHFDDVDFRSLELLHQVGRWAAGGTVFVTGGRCGAEWKTWSPPVTGFFVADDLVVTALEGTAPAGAYAWGDWTEDCERRRDDRGPFVRTFDGHWAVGSVVATDKQFAVVRLERVSATGDGPSSTWEPWSSYDGTVSVLTLGSPNLSGPRDHVTVHHPHAARYDGAWHVTTGKVDPRCGPSLYEEVAEGKVVVLDLYADDGSRGAPVLDDTGNVVGVLTGWSTMMEAALCGDQEDDPVSYSTLGILSTLRASHDRGAGFTPANLLANLLSKAGGVVGGEPVADTVRWPADAPIPTRTRLEVIDWGDQYTESGFPTSQLGNAAAFHAARQATVIINYMGPCPECDPDRRSTDFTFDKSICTGFAITIRLVITNGHCVEGSELGDVGSIRTWFGQDVEVDLVNHTYRTEEQVNGFHGDIALFRARHDLDLVPAPLADSDLLERFDPLITVGHPSIASRAGPFTTVVGSFISTGDYMQTYVLPSSEGASGSGVFDLTGAIVGQIAEGSSYRGTEESDIAWNVYGLEGTFIGPGPEVNVVPRPFEVSSMPVVKGGETTRGATANEIRRKVEQWAPGELTE